VPSFDTYSDFELDTHRNNEESRTEFLTYYSSTEQATNYCQSWDTEIWCPSNYMNAEQLMAGLCFQRISISCKCSSLEVTLYSVEWKTRNVV
jgi:hypothetical protein